MGSKKNGNNDFFGIRPNYIETINGIDKIVKNDDPLLQKFTAYKQYNAMQRIVFKPNETSSHNLNLQFSTTNNIPRYDRLTDLRPNGNLRTTTWHYGPQKRILAGYKFTKIKAFLNSDLSVGANYQNVQESRITRNYKATNKITRLEKVNVFSINADLKTKLGQGDLLYGAEVYYDNLNSTATSLNVLTNATKAADTRYSDGKNFSLRTDAFATYFAKINEKITYNLGARAGYASLKSEFVNKTFFPFPFSDVNQKNITYSASVGLTNYSTEKVKIAFNIASGFRTPNVDDLSKVFESAKGISLIVPNPDLKSEKNVTGDFNITLFDNKTFEFDNTIFYTR